MKRILSITVVVAILLTVLIGGAIADTPSNKYLQFTSLQDLSLIGNGTEWARWGNSATNYTTYATPGEDYIGDAGYAVIRQFTSPVSGTIKIDTEWTPGIKVGNQWTNSASAKYAITDGSGKILFPTDGQLGTVSYPNSVSISKDHPVTVDVEAGDVLNFVVIDDAGSSAPILFMARVVINDVSYNDSGYLRNAAFNTQGGNGWRYKYAKAVSVTENIPFSDLEVLIAQAESYDADKLEEYTFETAEKLLSTLTDAKKLTATSLPSDITSAAINLKNAISGLKKIPIQKFLEYTAEDLTLIGDGTGWQRWGNTATNYTTYATLGEDFIGNAGYAIIRQFTSPVSGTINIDTQWTPGLTVGNQWTPNAKAKYAITDGSGKIIYPTNGQLGTVTYPNPVTISKDDPVTIAVEAGDVINFVVIDDEGSSAPILFMARVLINDASYNDSGYLRNAAFNTQGGNGWRYKYAKSVNEVTKSDITALTTLITKAESILSSNTSKYTQSSIKALSDALATAKTLTTNSSQHAIDQGANTLREAIQNLEVIPTDSSIKRVAFTQKRMTFDEDLGVWTAENGKSMIAQGYSVSSSFNDGIVSIRKMVAPRTGNLQLKWGNGVYIDNSSGQFSGTSAEFIIADKLGRIIYPENGGSLKVKEGKMYPIELSLNNVAMGDSFYFIVFNASADNIPVVMNTGVSISNISISNTSGFLYGLDGAQGAGSWFYMYADDLSLLSDDGSSVEQPSKDEDKDKDEDSDNKLDKDYTVSPKTSDSSYIIKVICILSFILLAGITVAALKMKACQKFIGSGCRKRGHIQI